MTSKSEPTQPPEVLQQPQWLVYDGDCPLCSAYVKRLRLEKAAGQISMLNAREHGEVVDHLSAIGYNLDEGFVLNMNGTIYFGADCLHALALMTTPIGCFNRVNAWMFKSASRARYLYPLLRFGRNTLLKLLRREKISAGSR